MAKRVLVFLVLIMPFAFDLNLEAIYDIPKLSLLFSCTFLSFLFFIRDFLKKRSILVNLSSVFFVILLYFLINIISTIFSISPFLSIFGIYRRYDGMNTLLCYILLFFFFSNIEKPKTILYAIIISATISSFYGILQHFGFYIIPSLTARERVISLFGNCNFLACYLLMSIPIIISFYLKEKRQLFLIALIIVLIGLLFTKTRATFIGLFFELAFFFLFLRPKGKSILTIFIILIIILGIFSIPIIKRIKETTKDKARIGLYKGSMRVFLSYPLFGTGPECLQAAFIKNIPDEFRKEYKGAYILPDKSHNEFLDILATRGIIAFMLWVIILGAIFKTAILSKDRAYTIPIASSILGYLIQAQFNLSYFLITHLLWIMMGLIENTKKKKRSIIKHPKLIFSLSIIASFPIFFHIATFYLADMYFHKACVLERSGYKERAIIYYKMASSLNKWEREYAKREIEALLNLGKNKEAFEKAKRTLLFASDEPRIWFLLARAKENDDPKTSIIYYKKTISLSPYWADPYNNLAVVYVLSKDYENAERYFQAAYSLAPDYKENLKNIYKEQIGIYLKSHRLREAKDKALKILNLDPDDVYAQSVLKAIKP